MEYKITGLSDMPCKDQTFSLKQGKDANGEVKSIEIVVADYFKRHKGIRLRDSADLPCIDVGKPKKPCCFPIEFCTLVLLQRYTKALNSLQRASVVEVSRQKPCEQMQSLSNLKVGNEKDFVPKNGRWNFNKKKVIQPMVIDRWALVSFSPARCNCNIEFLLEGLKKCARMNGLVLTDPYRRFNEDELSSRPL